VVMGGDAHNGAGLVVVHDQLGEVGGCERIVESIMGRFPAAELVAPRFRTTNLDPFSTPAFETRARVAWHGGRRRHFLGPVYSRRIARVSLDGARVVFSSAGFGWSLAARVPADARHVAYLNGVPRMFDGDAPKYLLDYPRPLRPLLAATIPALRAEFGRLARKPHRLLTNSMWSVRALADTFGVHAEVVYPPVRTSFFTPEARERRHALFVGRLVPHKRVDALLDAFRGLDLELVIAGGGAWLERWRAVAPPNVRFTGYVSEDELRDLYRTSLMLIHPSREEFGIAMAEAQACGTPVISLRSGGALEIVRHGETGLLLDRTDASELRAAVRRVLEEPFSEEACRNAALPYSEERFVKEIEGVILQEMALAETRSAAEDAPLPQPGVPAELTRRP